MLRAACSLMVRLYAMLGGVTTIKMRRQNGNNINYLRFYH